MKFLLFLAIAVIAFNWLTRLKGQAASRGAPPSRTQLREPEPMLQCAHCSLHFPASEALMRDGKSYCSEQHLAAHARR
jgi:hypothetical protein